MTLIRIDSLDDPRVAPYRNMRERALRGELVFIAEGVLLIERLLASRYETASILSNENHAERLHALVGDDATVYVTTTKTLQEIAGYAFHRGALAVGRWDGGLSTEQFIDCATAKETGRIVVCPDIKTPDNLGLIFRTVAALGASGIVLSDQGASPVSRRVLRLSMGAALNVPFFMTDAPLPFTQRLRSEHGYETIATVLEEGAVELDRFDWPERSAILVGNEFFGLDDDWVAASDHRITIPMHGGTDSLNAAVATSIVLYEAMKAR